MWTYNYNYNYPDELYHFKYIKRYKNKKGKWVYVYNKPKKKTGGFNNGKYNNQQWTSYNDGYGNEITTIKGTNHNNKYVGISFGKVKNDKEYIEKVRKIGKLTLSYDNDNGRHNFTVSVDKGKKIVDKLFR